MPQSYAKVIAEQRQYALHADYQNFGLIVPEAFVRGIRHMGYRTNVEAIAELVDNSIQAFAESVDITFGYDPEGSGRKPTQLAIIDDGHGMTPEMMRFAMMWGGTHRENDRAGLGRFGYGLPCAAVSIGRRFTIYSKTKGKRLHSVTLDLGAIESGGGATKREVSIPAAAPARLPRFICQAIKQAHPEGWRSGTIIVIENLDRLDWSTATGLGRSLVRRFGVTYHKLLVATRITVDGTEVHPIDPLFLNPAADLFALDDDRAIALDPVKFRVETSEGRSGDVVLRYAWLPPSFAATDKSRDATGMNANARFPIIKQYHGILFSRNGRLLAMQPKTPWTIFMNNDRYIRVEVEFSAALDEAFGVTTSKQQVTVSPEMWDHLRVAGLHKAIEHLRAKVRAEKTSRSGTQPKLDASVGPTRHHAGRPARDWIPRGVPPARALRMLLEEIGNRSSLAPPAIQAAYRSLLEDWSVRMVDLATQSAD